MGSMVAQRLTQITPPTSTPYQLWQSMEVAWSSVPQEHIQSLFESMLRKEPLNETRRLLVTNLVILRYGQVTKTTPERTGTPLTEFLLYANLSTLFHDKINEHHSLYTSAFSGIRT
ncbi:hypothetical protein TNCV_1655461 [Trichonephila clavipes]|nr:hypothetical protein TNCV_1655461 [Trichonephila clavipes]